MTIVNCLFILLKALAHVFCLQMLSRQWNNWLQNCISFADVFMFYIMTDKKKLRRILAHCFEILQNMRYTLRDFICKWKDNITWFLIWVNILLHYLQPFMNNGVGFYRKYPFFGLMIRHSRVADITKLYSPHNYINNL